MPGADPLATIYHNPRCTTSHARAVQTLEMLRDNGIEPEIVQYPKRPFVVTAKGTRLARPIDAVREIL